MRTKEEIMLEATGGRPPNIHGLILEVLLNIRDLEVEAREEQHERLYPVKRMAEP